MLLASIPAKAVRDRTPFAVGVGLALGSSTVGFVAMASALETEASDLFDGMPAALQNLIGGGGGNYIVNEVFGLIAPIVLLVVAISGGVSVYAREESARTADLLLTYPVSRRYVVLARTAVLAANVIAAAGLFTLGATLSAAFIDIGGFGPADAFAASVHVSFLAVAFSMVALAAANVTGSSQAGMGVATALAVVSNLAAALLPLVDGLGNVAKLSPWYYFNGSDPLHNGIDVAHLTVLLGIAVGGLVVATVAVDRRDVRSGATSRLPEIPALAALAHTNVANTFSKTLTERTILIAVAGGSLLSMGVVFGPMFNGLESSLTELSQSLPDSVGDLIGTTDIGTPVGWIQAEMFSILAPLVVCAVAIVMGVAGIAGEDARRQLGLVAATGVSRRSLIVHKAAAGATAMIAIGAMCWVGIVLGSVLGGLDLSPGDVAAACVHMVMLGVFFAMFSLAVGAATTNTVAVRVCAGAALAAYLAKWLLDLFEPTDRFSALSPWHYYSAAAPLENGLDISHVVILAIGSGVALAAAAALFERRELNT